MTLNSVLTIAGIAISAAAAIIQTVVKVKSITDPMNPEMNDVINHAYPHIKRMYDEKPIKWRNEAVESFMNNYNIDRAAAEEMSKTLYIAGGLHGIHKKLLSLSLQKAIWQGIATGCVIFAILMTLLALWEPIIKGKLIPWFKEKFNRKGGK